MPTIIAAIMMLFATACHKDEPVTPSSSHLDDITLTIGGQSFTAKMEQNSTAEAFRALLPLTLEMQELNGNEKYHYLDGSLPTDSYKPGTIEAGDILLYGNNCVVLFYETFSSGYSYTRIGKLTSADGLKAALGAGNVSVTFAQKSATGVESHQSSAVRSQKALRDGQLLIEHNGETYNIEGKKL